MRYSYVTTGTIFIQHNCVLGMIYDSIGVGSEANSNLAPIFQDLLCPSKSDNTRAMVADEDDGTGASVLTLLRRRWGLE